MKIKALRNGSLGEADRLELARLLIKAGYIVRITKEIIPGRTTKATVIEYAENKEELSHE